MSDCPRLLRSMRCLRPALLSFLLPFLLTAGARASAPIRRVVAAGEQHTVVLNNDGTVLTWGDNTYGQLGDNSGVAARATPALVPNLNSVIAVSAGARHNLVLKSDGSVWAWGSNGSGQLGIGNTVTQLVPVKIGTLANIVAISAGNYHNLALRSDGTLFAWGSNVSNRLGDGTATQRNAPVPITIPGALKVKAIAAGGKHSLAVTVNDQVWAWGANTNGQLGDNTLTTHSTPTQIVSLAGKGVLSLAAGDSHSVAVTAAGAVYAWGNNGSGRLGIGATQPQQPAPVLVAGLANILEVEVGVDYSAAIGREGTVYTWGDNQLGQLADSTQTQRGTPAAVARLAGATALGAGFEHAVIVKSNGAVVAWGWDNAGQVGNGVFGESLSPGIVLGLNGQPNTMPGTVAAGEGHLLVLQGDGTVYAWGLNDYGQLGDGTRTTRTAPQPVPGLSGITALAAGGHHSLALASDGTVWAWGSNGSGQLGDGTGNTPAAPVKVKNLTGVTAIAAGEYHSFALKSDGTLWAWGSNVGGRLGDGTVTQRNSPVPVSTLVGPGSVKVTGMAAGTAHSLAFKSDGSIWAWGINTNGQVGDGTTTQRSTPVQLTSLTGLRIVGVSAGDSHSAAITSTGALYVWGNNGSSRLGLNSTDTQKNSPTLLSGFGNVAQVSAAVDHTLALKTDGTLWAWGDNRYGQIGDGTQVQRNVPVQVVSPVWNPTCLAASAYYSALVGIDSTPTFAPTDPKNVVVTWGYNPNGELGNGTAGTQLVPSQLAGLAVRTVVDTDKDGLSDDREADLGTRIDLPDTDGDTLTDLQEAGTSGDPLLAGSFVFRSFIDGGDQIHIKGSQAWIVHQNGVLPGGAGFSSAGDFFYGAPSYVNGTLWSPAWTNGNPVSGVYNSYTPLLPDTSEPVTYQFVNTALDGRGGAALVQMPSAGNGFEAVIQFSDTAPGAVWYEAALCWTVNIPGIGTNPAKYDTDGDGMDDGWEVRNGLRPLDPTDAGEDPDGDEITNLEEYWIKSGPHDFGNNFPGPFQLRVTRGASQSGPGGAQLTTPLTVMVLDANGNAVPNAPVHFKTSEGTNLGVTGASAIGVASGTALEFSGRTVADGGNFLPTLALRTDAAGTVRAYVKLHGLDGSLEQIRVTTTYGGVQSNSGQLIAQYSLAAVNRGGHRVAAGGFHTLAVGSSGQVWGWGLNSSGQLGDNTLLPRDLPTQTAGLRNIVGVAAGLYHSLALDKDGFVYTWGQNSLGQLGNGGVTDNPLAVRVPTLDRIVAIAAGAYHSLALRDDGTVFAWGANANGQLGNNSTAASTVPVVALGAGSGVTAIAAGTYHSLALTGVAQQVLGWGANFYHAVNFSGDSQVLVPTINAGVTGAAGIAAGAYHSMAVLGDGTAVAWGANANGQLGTGNASASRDVAPVLGLTHVVTLSASPFVAGHCLALLDDGSVHAWGANGAGQLGDGSATEQHTPVSLAAGSTAATIFDCAAGGLHSVAVNALGDIYTWGSNDLGQLSASTASNHVRAGTVPGLAILPDAADVNQNGLLDTWEQEKFGSLALTGDGDADGDGISNLIEFEQGRDPFKMDHAPMALDLLKRSDSLPADDPVANDPDPDPDAGRGIVTFPVQGNATQRVLVRLLGTSMAAQGLADPLPDPKMTFSKFVSATDLELVATSTDWNINAPPADASSVLAHNSAAEIAATGYAPPDHREPALLLDLEPGLYRIKFQDTRATNHSAQAGAVQVEVYYVAVDPATQASGSLTLYARGVVKTNEAVFMNSFPIAAGVTKNLAIDIKASAGQTSDSLTETDSSLRIYDNRTGAGLAPQIAFNDNWQSEPLQGAYLQSLIDAQKIEVLDPLDAALAMTFLPGSYTTIASVARSTTAITAMQVTIHLLETPDGATPDQIVPPPVDYLSDRRYVRNGGGGYAINQTSFVVPIDFENGQDVQGTENKHADGSDYDANHLPWFLRIDQATAHQIKVRDDVKKVPIYPFDFDKPMVSFGTQSGGSPLYTSQSYTFGLYAGTVGVAPASLRITWYHSSDFADGASHVDGPGGGTVGDQHKQPAGSMEIPLPLRGQTGWDTFASQGYILRQATPDGALMTSIRYADHDLGTDGLDTGKRGVPLIITHQCTDPQYYYQVDFVGTVPVVQQLDGVASPATEYWPMAVKGDSRPGSLAAATADQAYSLGYTLDFQAGMPWQSTFLTGPQFNGVPMPSTYYGKSLDEILHAAPRVKFQFDGAVPGDEYKAVGNSPELWEHRILDKFVQDMDGTANPLGLVNYVLNEIELTDALSYNDQGALDEASINPGGVNRGALATLLEGQGSPAEQCALMVYLLRKAGVPAGYVFPPHDGLKMLDEQMSKLLRMQLHNLADPDGGLTRVPRILSVNYPWVAAYVADAPGGQPRWVHIFPWIKDTDIKEGRDLYDYMPAGYGSGYEWLRKYIFRNNDEDDLITQVFKAGTGKDTVGALFQPFVERALQTYHPELSLADLGTQAYNRRNNLTSWDDLPRPWYVSTDAGQPALCRDLSNCADKDTIFDTVSFTVTKPNAADSTLNDIVLQTGALRTVDLHNRRLVVRSTPYTDLSHYALSLTLAPFETPLPGTAPAVPGDFTAGSDMRAKQVAMGDLTLQDDKLSVAITYSRHRKIDRNLLIFPGTPPSPLGSPGVPVDGSFLGINDVLQVNDVRPLYKGDLAAICLDFGRVTPSMLNVHAEEFWQYQQYLRDRDNVPPTVGADYLPDVFLGTPVYLLGMSYYEKIARFQSFAAPLHKVNVLSFGAHGFAKISPKRDSQGAIALNGTQIQYVRPNVDMSFQRLAYAGNGTLRPDSGLPTVQANDSFLTLLIGQVSSGEHEAIDSFFQRTGSVSTIRLLQAAHRRAHRASNPAEDIVILDRANYHNYDSLGDPAGNADAWKVVTEGFAKGYPGEYQQVFITPHPIAVPQTGDPAYLGMGTLVLNPTGYGAYITADRTTANGGYSDFSVPDTSFAPENYTQLTLQTAPAPDGGSDFSLVSPQLELNNSGTLLYNGAPSESQIAQTFGLIADHSLTTNALQDYTLNSVVGFDPVTPLDSAEIVGTLQAIEDAGALSAYLSSVTGETIADQTSYYRNADSDSASSLLSDPVSPMTGEFYIDDVDLRLNGPMPLEVRRNYSSRNLADGDFGCGWKMSYAPYLSVKLTKAAGTMDAPQPIASQEVLYAAEMDGSVVAYHRQAAADGSFIPQWKVLPRDNPYMVNQVDDQAGSLFNPFNARIEKSAGTYTLTGADGSQRVYVQRSFPLKGIVPDSQRDASGNYPTQDISRRRPYLRSWTDNRGVPGTSGNCYTFSFYGDDDNENDLTIGYGHLKRVEASNGNFLSFVYDTFGHVLSVTAGDGRQVRYLYNDQGDLINVTRPDGSTVRYDYQYHTDADGGQPYSQHLIIREVKPEGRVVENVYEDTTQKTRRVTLQRATVGLNNALTQNATFAYHTQAQYVTPSIPGDQIDAKKPKLIGGYTEVRDAAQNLVTYKFDRSRIVEIDDPQTFGVASADAHAQVVQSWSDTGQLAAGEYPCSLKQRTDKRGLIAGFIYDAAGNVKKKTLRGNLSGIGGADDYTEILFDYVQPGEDDGFQGLYPNRLRRQTDPSGNCTEYTYGDSSHPYLATRVSRKAGGAQGAEITATTNSYHDVPRANPDQVSGFAYGLLESTSTDGVVIHRSYNSTGFFMDTERVEHQVVPDPSIPAEPSVKRHFTYNLRGERTSETDPAGNVTRYAYDGLGNRTWQEHYSGDDTLLAWQYDYFNRNGQLEWSDGPRYNPEDYVLRRYDGGGRLKEETHWRTEARADGSGVQSPADLDQWLATTVYEHDAVGNLSGILDARHNRTQMGYDGLGRMTARVALIGNPPPPDLRTALPASAPDHPVEQWSYGYSPDGRPMQTYTNSLGGVTRKLYTSTGLLAEQDNPDGSTLSWVYGLDGRLARETYSNNSYTTVDYDDAGRTVKRTLFNANGSDTLSVQTTTYDGRGNAISQTDTLGNVTSTTYDAFKRVRTVTGPDASSFDGVQQSARQTSRNDYDDAGQTVTATNGRGQQTISRSDALGRPKLTRVLDSAGTEVRRTSYAYSPDHQAMTETRGTADAGGIVTTIYTDTAGRTVLSRHADNRFATSSYDNLGNLVASVDERGAATLFDYDAFNRLKVQQLPGKPDAAVAAQTTFDYDAAGNALRRNMPSGQTLVQTFDAASRKTSEELESSLPTVAADTRRYVYEYYPAGANLPVGRLHTVTDARGVMFSTAYDGFLRPVEVDATCASTLADAAFYNQSTAYTYDALSRLTRVSQHYGAAGTLPSTEVDRAYDGAGRISHEKVLVGAEVVSEFDQNWDAAGRRVLLKSLLPGLPGAAAGAGRATRFGWRADGLLAEVKSLDDAGAVYGDFTFQYGDNGLLIERQSEQDDEHIWRTQMISGRDAQGRVEQQSVWLGHGGTSPGTSLDATTPLMEIQHWRDRAQRADYGLSRLRNGGTWNDDHTYDYNERGQLYHEKWRSYQVGNLFAPQSESQYRFDFEAAGSDGAPAGAGLGVRTDALRYFGFGGNVAQAGSWQSPVIDPFVRPVTETQYWGAAGSPLKDGQTASYDAVGEETGRDLRGCGAGTPLRHQAMQWDASGRLVAVSDTGADGTGNFQWSAIYDGLGRRVRTGVQPLLASGAANTTAGSTVTTSQFDPQAEFLEVAVEIDKGSGGAAAAAPVRLWEVHGPDLNGVYGGLQGTGGLEALVNESGGVTPLVSDLFGNVVGYVAGIGGAEADMNFVYNAPANAYGLQQAAPGEEPAVTVEHPPQALDPQDMGSLAAAYAWRGRRFDATGLCWLGARYYEPLGGRFLSADPLGHGSDMSLYAYAGGDPVNGLDPDGRLAFGFGKGYTLGSFAHQDNLAQAIGGIVGQFASYLTPGYGEVALLRDALYSAGQVGETLEDISENGLTGSNALRLGVNLAGSLPLVGAESRLFGALEHEVGAEAGLIEREIGTGLGETESLSGSLGEAEEAVERDFQEACESNTMCFVSGTPVATESGLKPIEEIKVGSRVLNSEEQLAPDEAAQGKQEAVSTQTPQSLRKVSLRLVSPDGSGDVLAIELLRTEGWVTQKGAVLGARLWFELPEMGVAGWAGVVGLERGPPIEPGAGRVVLATITHYNGHVLRLGLIDEASGRRSELEPTATHRLYSQERARWVPAGELRIGERLRTRTGTVRLERVEAERGAQRVYNLEVESEHDYFVGPQQVLSHNTGDCSGLGTDTEGMSIQSYVDSLPTKLTPTGTARDLYEIENTGPLNYLVKGGGEKIWIDGIDQTTILESKFISDVGRSPFVPSSNIPSFLRDKITSEVSNEISRMGAIIRDPANPFTNIRIITNEPSANSFFQDLLKQHDVPGDVVNP